MKRLRQLPGSSAADRLRNKSGRALAQHVVEYGLIVAVIVLVILLGVASFGHLIEPWLAGLAGHLTTVGT